MIKYSIITTLCIALVSCSINGKHDSLSSETVNYEAKIDSILALMTIEEKYKSLDGLNIVWGCKVMPTLNSLESIIKSSFWVTRKS